MQASTTCCEEDALTVGAAATARSVIDRINEKVLAPKNLFIPALDRTDS